MNGAGPPGEWKLRHTRRLEHLLRSVVDALWFCPLAWPRSLLGRLSSMRPAPFSEYRLFWCHPLRYLAQALIPSLPVKAPTGVPRPLSSFFFHRSRELQPPDANGALPACMGEKWFFINGILTDEELARVNGAYLTQLFHRPITILWNSSEGVVLDLAECASEKLGARDADVDMAFHPLLDAIADHRLRRVVLIAHSQGTLITAVVLRLIQAVYRRTMAAPSGVLTRGDCTSIEAQAKAEGLTVRTERLKPVRREDLKSLEVYCFANCATTMTYVDQERSLPTIESFGNEHDLVARLGMLALHPKRGHITIAGPRFRRHGAWGHLLDAHYLVHIDPERRPAGPAPPWSPYVLIEGTACAGTLPRLFTYLNGAGAIP